MSSIPPAELEKFIHHLRETYTEIFDRLAQIEYNENVKRDSYMEGIIDSIIATVRYGDPAHLKNDLLAILELVVEHEKESQ